MAVIQREAQIHFELHRALMNVISTGKKFDSIEFTKAEPEYPIKGIGRADLVIFDKGGKPWLVIETKSPLRTKDPYDPKVIDQALRYASWLGAYYFATCDARTFVLFDNKEKGVTFWERKRIPPYDLGKERSLLDFADKILQDIVSLEQGIKKWSALDEAFVQRLKVLHERLVDPILDSLKREIDKQPKFKAEYKNWLDKQGFEFNKDTMKKTAIETAYLLINKILFYKMLEPKYDENELPRLKKAELLLDKDAVTQFGEQLEKCFSKALKIDYKAVFQPGIFDEIPLPQPTVERLNEFLDEASSYDLSKIQSDVLGQIYEGLIPKDERRKLGQYYTPPAICDLLVRMCVKKPNDFVLDPGCGSGGFLVKAYHRLLALRGIKTADEETHQDILKHLWGVDISQFPAHLSVINLALRNINVRSDMINILPSDFFRVFANQTKLKPLSKLTLEEVIDLHGLPPQFDAVVCNPPYTRGEEIGDTTYKEEVRRVSLSIDSKKYDISARAGIYAYFFTHSSHFLKEKGMMGYIVSNSWLDVDFGKDLQQFFLDNFRIGSIIEFDKRAFAEAAINTVLIIMQKMTGKKYRDERDNNDVKFVRIKTALPTEDIIDLVEGAHKSYENDKVRFTFVKQRKLRDDPRWGKYLRAPSIYFDILENPKITSMEQIADVNRGVTTGANEFFILDKKQVKQFELERTYLRPCIASPQEIKKIHFEKEDVQNFIVAVHKDKSHLRGTNILRYINDGERKGFHRRPTTKNRTLWYDIGQRDIAPILMPYLVWERSFAVWNETEAISNKQLYEIYPKKKSDTLVLLGILNSTLAGLLIELQGVIPLGEGVLDLRVYDTQRLPILNPQKLSDAKRERIEKAFLQLCKAQDKGDEQAEKEAKKKLDNAVLEALDMSGDEGNLIEEALMDLREMRKRRSEVEVLIQHPETKKRTTKQVRMKEFMPTSTPLTQWFEASDGFEGASRG